MWGLHVSHANIFYRFDVRGLLTDIKRFEPQPPAKSSSYKTSSDNTMSREDMEFEQKLDEERYADLISDDVMKELHGEL